MTQDEAVARLAECVEDPILFCRLCWPDIDIYDKQREILLSVRDNIETFCHASNEVGKDFIASIIAVWFFASRKPARVITSSSSETQLKSILWSEIRARINTSQIPLGFRIPPHGLRVERYVDANAQRVDPMSYMIGHVTNTVENFQGHHLADYSHKPRVLAIFDEASGVPDEYYEAAGSWADRILAIGNPMNNLNFFYRNCKEGDLVDPAEKLVGAEI